MICVWLCECLALFYFMFAVKIKPSRQKSGIIFIIVRSLANGKLEKEEQEMRSNGAERERDAGLYSTTVFQFPPHTGTR